MRPPPVGTVNAMKHHVTMTRRKDRGPPPRERSPTAPEQTRRRLPHAWRGLTHTTAHTDLSQDIRRAMAPGGS